MSKQIGNEYVSWLPNEKDQNTIEKCVKEKKSFIILGDSDCVKGVLSEVAEKYGYKKYVGTLLPIYGWRTYAPFRDEMRCEFNGLLREEKRVDGVIDFDKAVSNGAKEAGFAEGYDSGDHLHPSAEGYKRMAMEALKIFE